MSHLLFFETASKKDSSCSVYNQSSFTPVIYLVFHERNHINASVNCSVGVQKGDLLVLDFAEWKAVTCCRGAVEH